LIKDKKVKETSITRVTDSVVGGSESVLLFVYRANLNNFSSRCVVGLNLENCFPARNNTLEKSSNFTRRNFASKVPYGYCTDSTENID
jgi:hypothetical protein